MEDPLDNQIDDRNEKKLKVIDFHIGQLLLHFDSVHIFCTKYEGKGNGGTSHFNVGEGNWYARYGQIKEWTIREEKKQREDLE